VGSGLGSSTSYPWWNQAHRRRGRRTVVGHGPRVVHQGMSQRGSAEGEGTAGIETTRMPRLRRDLSLSRPAPSHHGRGADRRGPMPRPGGVSCAHDGARCLDELPECRRHVLEVLRQPLEEGFSAYQSGVSRRLRKMGLPPHGSHNGGGRKPTEAVEEADEEGGPFYRTPKEPAAVALPEEVLGRPPRNSPPAEAGERPVIESAPNGAPQLGSMRRQVIEAKMVGGHKVTVLPPGDRVGAEPAEHVSARS
jgi:Magnesium chelatase, subunit ChlI